MPDPSNPPPLTPEERAHIDGFMRDVFAQHAQPDSALSTSTQSKPEQTPGPSLKSECDDLRAQLRAIEIRCRSIKDHPVFKGEQAYAGQHGEMIAQSMLAVRHIEDARMRIGKVLQYSGDGVSIYDKA
jgi:hypothetical protein